MDTTPSPNQKVTSDGKRENAGLAGMFCESVPFSAQGSCCTGALCDHVVLTVDSLLAFLGSLKRPSKKRST